MLLTYERLDLAARTLRAVLGLAYTEEPVHLHIADDGSANHDAHLKALYAIAKELWDEQQHPRFGEFRFSWHNTERRGYGASYNLATQFLHEDCDKILVLEDDWELSRPLDLDGIARMLDAETPLGPVGCVRLGYLGFWQPIYAEFLHIADQTVALLHPGSPSQDVFAGHPRLETRDFQRRVGPWPEDTSPGETELTVAGRGAARNGVIWPVDLVHPRGDLFGHIGTASLNAVRPGERI